ncbi:hypothetical protein K438DRAFT_1777457 [Mycena galopus ATCC 62051]|nr:hypothetical protein K438DRAFT_1777457 [Mycena galopus ATCC 62051]
MSLAVTQTALVYPANLRPLASGCRQTLGLERQQKGSNKHVLKILKTMNEILDLFVGLYARNLWAVLSPDLETGKLASRDSLTQITASHHDKLQPACLVQMSLQAKLSSGKWKVFIWLIRNSSSAAYWHKMAEGFPNRNLFGVLGNPRSPPWLRTPERSEGTSSGYITTQAAS